MKKLTIGLLFALMFSLGAYAARTINVTTPMTIDLDAGGYNILNAGNFITSNGALLGGDGVLAHAFVFSATTTMTPPFTIDFAGTDDPRNAPEGNNPVGSLYRRIVDSAHGELWFKTGPLGTDWVRIAP